MSDVTSAESEVVAQLRAFFASRPEVRLALLFGSRARGTARGDADVDVAVSGEDLDLLRLGTALEAALGRPVDVVNLEDPSYPLRQAILRDGIVVHRRDPGVEARWRTRAILENETDRPWFARMARGFLREQVRRLHG